MPEDFYDQGAKSDGVAQGKIGDTETGPIADREAARDVASVEATQGRDSALRRESELKQQHEAGGLTEKQVANEKTMKALLDTYPHALKSMYDESGRQVVVQSKPSSARDGSLLMTRDRSALYFPADDRKIDFSKIDLKGLLDLMFNPDEKLPVFTGIGAVTPVNKSVGRKDGSGAVELKLLEIDVLNPNLTSFLRIKLQSNEKFLGEEYQPVVPNVDEVISGLTKE